MTSNEIHQLLEAKYKEYNNKDFIERDPIRIPHRFSKLQDIEIAAFWTAILAWGNRTTIINKATELFELMGNSPHQFILNHKETDLKPFVDFKHRTFQADDTLYFIEFLRHHYSQHDSLENAFFPQENMTVFDALSSFRKYFFSLGTHLDRTKKHIASPLRKSTCKRLNMFLRWMVRYDEQGVDFGLWTRCTPDKLMIPFDVHVQNVSKSLGLLTRKQRDWKAVEQITEALRKYDPNDPVKYDYALFGMGVTEKW